MAHRRDSMGIIDRITGLHCWPFERGDEANDLNLPDHTVLIEREIAELERRGNLFETSILPEKTWTEQSKIVAIYDHIDHELAEIFINTSLKNLRDERIAILAVHAFYGSQSLHDKFVSSTYPIFSGLLISFALRKIRKKLEDNDEFSLVDDFKKLEQEYETHVCSLLDAAHNENEETARKALSMNYYPLIEREIHMEKMNNFTLKLLDVAMKAKTEKFLDHILCRKVTYERWTPGFSISRWRFIIYFCTIFPVVFSRLNATEQIMRMCWIRKYWSKLKSFYNSPCGKFAAHTLFYFVYIFLFAFVLISQGQSSRFSNILPLVYLKAALMLWQTAFIVDMLVTARSSGIGYKWADYNPVDFYHNVLNMIYSMALVLCGYDSCASRKGRKTGSFIKVT